MFETCEIMKAILFLGNLHPLYHIILYNVKLIKEGIIYITNGELCANAVQYISI